MVADAMAVDLPDLDSDQGLKDQGLAPVYDETNNQLIGLRDLSDGYVYYLRPQCEARPSPPAAAASRSKPRARRWDEVEPSEPDSDAMVVDDDDVVVPSSEEQGRNKGRRGELIRPPEHYGPSHTILAEARFAFVEDQGGSNERLLLRPIVHVGRVEYDPATGNRRVEVHWQGCEDHPETLCVLPSPTPALVHGMRIARVLMRNGTIVHHQCHPTQFAILRHGPLIEALGDRITFKLRPPHTPWFDFTVKFAAAIGSDRDLAEYFAPACGPNWFDELVHLFKWMLGQSAYFFLCNRFDALYTALRPTQDTTPSQLRDWVTNRAQTLELLEQRCLENEDFCRRFPAEARALAHIRDLIAYTLPPRRGPTLAWFPDSLVNLLAPARRDSPDIDQVLDWVMLLGEWYLDY